MATPSILLDTDVATDCDDAAALAALHTLADRDQATIEAVLVNNRGEHSVGAVAAINAYYDRSDVPLGAYKGDAVGVEAAAYYAEVARDTATYGHSIVTRDDARDAVDVYRETLAAVADSPDGESAVDDGPTRIVSIGHLNNLHALLESGPDEHSSKSGVDLVESAVDQLVVMGGEFPAGTEHNLAARGAAAVSRETIERWPTPILFAGFEVGEAIETGRGLARAPPEHPVRRIYAGHPSDPLETDRASWDQVAVLAAVRRPEYYWRLSDPGRIIVHDDGSNEWTATDDGTHRHLQSRSRPSPEQVAAVVEELMVDSARNPSQ